MQIGNVVTKGGGRFEWIIPHFSTLPRNMYDWFYSPDFNAEGVTWHLWIEPRNWGVISFQLKRSSDNRKPLSCTISVKRADHSEETIGTETCGGYTDPDFILKKTRRELENEDWLLDDQLTVTCVFGKARVPRAKRRLTSRESKTDGLDTKIRKVEILKDSTCIGDEGANQLIENLKELLTEEDGDYDVRIFVKSRVSCHPVPINVF